MKNFSVGVSFRSAVPHFGGLAIVACLLFGPAGCSFLTARNDTRQMEYVRGEMQSTFDLPLAQTWQATQSAIEGAGLTIKSRRADGFSAVLKTEDAQARTIEITVEKIDETHSLVKIHVGLLGDADFSKKLMDAIDAKIKH